MARKSVPKDDVPETPGMLPLPEPVIRHHSATILGPMREWKQQGRVPPTLLLTGTAGCGKRSIAYWLAQWILCERNGFARAAEPEQDDPFTASLFGDAPAPEVAGSGLSGGDRRREPGQALDAAAGGCNDCAACLRAVKGSWVDFTEVLPEDSSGEAVSSGTLKVDQFRKIKATLGFGSHEGAFKIVLIPNADRMTVQAANSVLKLLEEPPPGWLFFLTASDPTLVLPTILSRCQSLRLKPFSAAELVELLELAGVDPRRREIGARLAQGSWSKALALASDDVWEHRKALFGFLKEPGSQLNALVDWGSQVPGNFDQLVDQLEQLASELIRWSVAAGAGQPHAWISTDGEDALSLHAQSVVRRMGSHAAAREFWIERAERLARARQEATAPLNRKLLIQDLLLPWLRAV